MTTPPNLTKLNFDDIKQSLTDFLKNQSVFVGYNFQGTVIQTLIDLLSYNTYYYAFYSNMMSNELFLDTATRVESLVSLVKPLGYTVPGKKSSSTTIKIYREGETELSRYTKFTALDSNGVYYTFYNNLPIPLTDGVGDDILVTEGYEVIDSLDITNLFDLTKQRYILNEEDVDISTIRVEVRPYGQTDWVEWTNVNFFPNNEDTIFYIERMGQVFTIELGKYNNLGKSLEDGDSIRISYLLSSGSSSNELYQFSEPNSLILDVYFPASGGSEGPDFNTIKFLAPKVFSGQERAVTKQDYIALLMKNNFITDISQVAIYGGDEVYPPKYGRVFVSFLPFNGIGNAQDIINYLRDKNTLTVLPEYILPQTAGFTVVASASFANVSSPQKQSIINSIRAEFNSTYENYSTNYGFNLELDSDSYFNDIKNQFAPNGLSSLITNYIQCNFTISNTDTSEISLNYPIVRNESPGANLFICDSFFAVDEYENKLMTIKLPTPIDNHNDQYVPLEAYEVLPNGTYSYRDDIDVGSINYEKGHILINKIYKTETLNIKIKSYNKNISPLVSIASKISLILE